MAANRIEVSMSLTQKTAQSANHLQQIFHANNKAEVVSISVRLMELIINSLDGGDLLIRKKNGDMFKVEIPGIDCDLRRGNGYYYKEKQ